MPTARNARGIDLVAYYPDGTHFIGVQVKVLSKRSPVPLGKGLEELMGDFWVIVNDVRGSLNAFVLTPDEVKRSAYRGEKGGRVSFWLQPKDYDNDSFREAWNRIGSGS